MSVESAAEFVAKHAGAHRQTSLHDLQNLADLDRLNYLFGPPQPVTSAASEPIPGIEGSR